MTVRSRAAAAPPVADSHSGPGAGLGDAIDTAVAIDAAVAELWPRAVTMLVDLVAMPSVVGTSSEVSVVAWLNERLVDSGLETDMWKLPLEQLRADADYPGEEVERSQAWGVVGRLAGGAGPTLMLQGHLDVVPEGDRNAWSTGDPFSGQLLGDLSGGGLVQGRGAADMKGGVVAAWLAVAAVQAAGLRAAGDVLLAGVIGEEDGGLGAFGLLKRGWTADAAVITEPTELAIVPANGGALTFRLLVPGKATHASTRKAGVSAIDTYLHIHQALRRLEDSRNLSVDPLMSRWDPAYALEIGRVAAGDWASTVPDQLVAEGRFGVALGESASSARADFEAAIALACREHPFLVDHPVRVEWWGGQFASGRTDPAHAIVGALGGHHNDVLGAAPELYGAPYGSDLRLLTELGGIPTVQYGPGDPKVCHTVNEFVPLDQVRQCAQVLARLLVAGF